MFLRPPALPDGAESAFAPFPDPGAALESLQGTRLAHSITDLAGQILQHRFPVLGVEIETGAEIRWRRDYLSGKETEPRYFRTIPYLDAGRAGDHKMIWELNRHQHLVLLAQAHRLTGRADFLTEIERQLDSWLLANPYQCGINWTSALEVAFRALSWMWVDHLIGALLTAQRRRRLLEELYRHAWHLEANLSVYFSPNTHVLGEAVALHALGRMFRRTPRGQAWERLGARLAGEAMDRQVQSDGSHFERSSYYHLYALDMFLFHAILAPVAEVYRSKLTKMAEYLDALMGPTRSLPFLGDDDGGRFFHPFGPRDRFGRATLAVCGLFLERFEWIAEPADVHECAAWWLGAPSLLARSRVVAPRFESIRFPDAGTVAMQAGDTHCLIRAGGFGPFRAGHSHADALSIVARMDGHDLLVDPGTFTYAGDSKWRGIFRGTAAHNTVRVNRLDQADPAGPFGWRNPPQVSVSEWHTDSASDFLDAACLSRGIRHRRRVLFLKPDLLFIVDDVEFEQGGAGDLLAEQFWHPGSTVRTQGPSSFRIGDAGTLLLVENRGVVALSEGGEWGWHSPAYGFKQPSPVIVSSQQGGQSVHFGAVLAFSPREYAGRLVLTTAPETTEMVLGGSWRVSVTFASLGRPRVS